MSPVGRKSKGLILDAIETVTTWGWQGGGLVFIAASVYLLWGILDGSLANTASMQLADRTRVLDNIALFCKVMSASGIILVLSAAIRYYNNEITGYILLIGGALLHWGMPMAIASAFQQVSLAAISESLYNIVGNFRIVGIIAVVTALPFILADFWFKIQGVRRDVPRKAVVVGKGKADEPPKSRFHIFCWQMPFCRDYLRGFCKAYEQRKSCWRIKSGCYCDEDMILRVMKTSNTGKMAGFDQKFSDVAGGKSRDMTAAQRRERCRQCFLYVEHQKQKYRMLSPLAFPATAFILWTYFKPMKAVLSSALLFTDKLAGNMSYGQYSQQWTNAQATSETVLWLFLGCVGLILVTYVLRALEYAIFDLQV